jgi:hypothetical protein
MSSSLSPDSANTRTSSSERRIVQPPAPPDEAAAATTTNSAADDIREGAAAEPKSLQEGEGQGSQQREIVASMEDDRRRPAGDSPQFPTLGRPEDDNTPTLKSNNNNNKMEALEIDIADIEGNNNTANEIPGIAMTKSQDSELDDDLDRANADMEGLLSSSSGNHNDIRNSNSSNNKRLYQTKRVTRRPKTSSSTTSLPCEKCCVNGLERHGNCVVFVPRAYFAKTHWGIMGPHWFGPPCCAALIVSSSMYFIRHAVAKIGPISAGIGILFTVLNLYLLVNTCYRNPGIVMPVGNDDDDGAPSAQHRWYGCLKNIVSPQDDSGSYRGNRNSHYLFSFFFLFVADAF